MLRQRNQRRPLTSDRPRVHTKKKNTSTVLYPRNTGERPVSWVSRSRVALRAGAWLTASQAGQGRGDQGSSARGLGACCAKRLV